MSVNNRCFRGAILMLLLMRASAYGDPTSIDPSSESPFLSAAASLAVDFVSSTSTSANPSSTIAPRPANTSSIFTPSSVSTNSTSITPSASVNSSSTITPTTTTNNSSTITPSSTTNGSSTITPTTTSASANSSSTATANTTSRHSSTRMKSSTSMTSTNTSTATMNHTSTPHPHPTSTPPSSHPKTTSSSAPSCPTGAPVTSDCSTSLAIAVGVSIPGTAIITFFITSLTCLCCQKVKKKRSYIRLAPTVYFDEEEQD